MHRLQVPLDGPYGQPAFFRRAAIRLTRACPVLDTGLIPNRCRPTATSWRGSRGSLRFRAQRTPPGDEDVFCNFGRTHRKFDDLPGSLHPTPAQGSMAFGAKFRSVGHLRGGFHPQPGEALLTLPAGLLCFPRPLLGPGGQFVARHPGSRPAAGQPGFQAFDPLAQFGDDPLLFRDNRQQVSRLAWSKSSPVSIVPLCHNSAPAASIFQPGGGLRQIRLTNSEQLPLTVLGSRRLRRISCARFTKNLG